MTNETLKRHEALAEIVAEHLTRIYRPVTLRIQQPGLAACKGTAEKTASGGVITITPEGDAMDQLQIFLHECAHLRSHWPEMEEKDTSGGEVPPGAIAISADELRELQTPADQLEEAEAEALTATWMKFADEHRDLARGDIEGRLLALLEWYGDDSERLIDRVALKITEMRKRARAAESLHIDHAALKRLAKKIKSEGLNG